MVRGWHICGRASGGSWTPGRTGAAESLAGDSQPLPLNFQVEHPWGTDAFECGCGERFAFVFDVDIQPRVRVMSCPVCDCVHYQIRPGATPNPIGGGAMRAQRVLPGVRLRMTARERRLLIRERLVLYPVFQRAREERRRKRRERRRYGATAKAAAVQRTLF